MFKRKLIAKIVLLLELKKLEMGCLNELQEISRIKREVRNSKREEKYSKREEEYSQREDKYSKREEKYSEREEKHSKREVKNSKREVKNSKREVKNSKRARKNSKREIMTVKKRRYWVKPLLIKRSDFDMEAYLLKDVLWEDDNDLNNFSPLNINQFEEILSLIEHKIKKNDTHMRLAISPRTKLAIVLRFLATGDSISSLELLTRVAKSTISNFMPSVIRAIYDALKDVYLKEPDTEEEWENIAKDFNDIWQFPHTLGALGGKHIHIKPPSNNGCRFYNIKGFFSVVVFASVDAHGRFTFVDVAKNGKESDSTIYQDSYLYNSMENGDLNIPRSKELVPGRGSKVPYFFIADDEFSLDKHLMTPHSRNSELNTAQEVFNYRLCRAHTVMECAFDRLSKRFGIFTRPIEVQTSTVDLTIMTACVLHNYFTKKKDNIITPDFESTTKLPSIGAQENKTYQHACRIREEISNYLVTDGDVDFQWIMDVKHD